LTNFYNAIREKAKEKFNVPFHDRIYPVFFMAKAAYLYDAVIVYAKAATKILEEGGNLRDGRTLMQKYVFNNTFTSKQGFDVFIDENGNAEGNFSLIGIQLVNNTYRMEKIGNFIQNQSSLPSFKLIPGKQIMWINGYPTIDEPECGFEGCPIDKSFMILCSSTITLSAFICIFLLRFPLIYIIIY